MKGEGDTTVITGNSPKVLLEHLHLCKPGRPANNELWSIFQQQFRAEGTLMSDSNNNEL